MQARGDPVGDDAGAEPARGGALAATLDTAAEDQAGLVRAADVQVVADDLLEEDPPVHRGVEGLGEGELRLQDRQLVAVPGRGVAGGERVRQDAQPPGGQRLDLAGVQAIADRLHRGHVIDSGKRVVQRDKADAGLGGLPLGVLAAVDDQPPGIREVTRELHADRPEVFTGAVEVMLVDHTRGRDQPRVGGTGDRVTALDGPEHLLLFLRHARIQHLPGHQPPVIEPGPLQVLPGDVVLALPLGEAHQVHAPGGDEMADIAGERRRHRGHQHRGREPVTPVPHEERGNPGAVLQPRLVKVTGTCGRSPQSRTARDQPAHRRQNQVASSISPGRTTRPARTT